MMCWVEVVERDPLTNNYDKNANLVMVKIDVFTLAGIKEYCIYRKEAVFPSARFVMKSRGLLFITVFCGNSSATAVNLTVIILFTGRES